jgi:hypothetical protein
MILPVEQFERYRFFLTSFNEFKGAEVKCEMCITPSRVLKKCFAPGADRERNGIQESPERNQTAAEMSFSTAC